MLNLTHNRAHSHYEINDHLVPAQAQHNQRSASCFSTEIDEAFKDFVFPGFHLPYSYHPNQ